MTALSAGAIRDRLKAKDPARRLVVSPLLDPNSQIKSSQAAIDVRLGPSFALVRPWTHGVAERVEDGEQATPPVGPIEPPLERIFLQYGEALIIHPHQFVLARTLEFVRLPDDLLAYVIGRSSWGRRGLIVATAVMVHPGFAGPITLELKNVGEVPIALYPMDCVAQLAFHQVSEMLDAPPPRRSQFASSYVPTLGNVRDAQTEFAIKAISRANRGDRK